MEEGGLDGSHDGCLALIMQDDRAAYKMNSRISSVQGLGRKLPMSLVSRTVAAWQGILNVLSIILWPKDPISPTPQSQST